MGCGSSKPKTLDDNGAAPTGKNKPQNASPSPAAAAAAATATAPAAAQKNGVPEPEVGENGVKAPGDSFPPVVDTTTDADWVFGYPSNVEDHVVYDGPQLGEGTFGKTFRGTWKASNVTCAVKHIDKKAMRQRGNHPGALKKEVEALKSLAEGHPNVVQLYGVFESEDELIIAMEYCRGGELMQRIISKGRFTEKDAARIVRQMLKVVAEIHFLGIVHRDLKPENFMFAKKEDAETIKIIDFGLAERFSLHNTDKPLEIIEAAGTVWYMAPEVPSGRYSFTADVWSIGVITYTMLCGHPPFMGSSVPEIYQKLRKGIQDENYADPPWPGISKDAKDFIRTLCDKDATARVSAAQALSLPWVKEGGTAPDAPLDVGAFVMMNRFHLLDPLTRFVLHRLVHELREDDSVRGKILCEDAFRAEFDAVDTTHDGAIDFDEFKQAAGKFLSGEYSEEEARKVFDAMDSNKNGVIDFVEFVAATMRMSQVLAYYDVVCPKGWKFRARQLFESLDSDNDGFITEEDLAKVLPPGEDPKEYIAKSDRDNDGKIGLKDFGYVLVGADRVTDTYAGDMIAI